MTDAPLAGRRVLVPRPAGQASSLSRRIERLGGEPVEAPVLLIEPGDVDDLRRRLRELYEGAFTAVCITSPNGVDAVADALVQEELPAAVLDPPLVAVVGSGTERRLGERLGRRADLLPPRATTEALGEAFPAGSGVVLLPRADLANPVLPRLLREKGYDCVDVVAYRTTAPPSLPDTVVRDLSAGAIDLVALTSSSAVRNLMALIGSDRPACRVVSIGPVTSATCREYGLEVAAEADPHDLDGLVAALVRAAA